MDVAGVFSPVQIDWVQAVLRFACAILLPLAIGVERFVHKKPIDFRPFVIISVAACALTMGGLQLAFRSDDPQVTIDPTRIFAGVITGIGFLGAGAMFRKGELVLGSGSAAAVWAAGAIGILSGAGLLWLAMIVGLLVFAILLISAPIVRDEEQPKHRAPEAERYDTDHSDSDRPGRDHPDKGERQS